jgi:hypothetical protein
MNDSEPRRTQGCNKREVDKSKARRNQEQIDAFKAGMGSAKHRDPKRHPPWPKAAKETPQPNPTDCITTPSKPETPVEPQKVYSLSEALDTVEYLRAHTESVVESLGEMPMPGMATFLDEEETEMPMPAVDPLPGEAGS